MIAYISAPRHRLRATTDARPASVDDALPVISLPAIHPPSRRTAQQLGAGAYLTDGERLFRVVSRLRPDQDVMCATLEDCLTLEVSRYSPDELYAMRLRCVGRSRGRA